MEEYVNYITTDYFTQSVSPSISPIIFAISEYRN